MVTTIIISITAVICCTIICSTVKTFATTKYKADSTYQQTKVKITEPTITQEQLDKLQQKENSLDIGQVMEFLDSYDGGAHSE